MWKAFCLLKRERDTLLLITLPIPFPPPHLIFNIKPDPEITPSTMPSEKKVLRKKYRVLATCSSSDDDSACDLTTHLLVSSFILHSLLRRESVTLSCWGGCIFLFCSGKLNFTSPLHTTGNSILHTGKNYLCEHILICFTWLLAYMGMGMRSNECSSNIMQHPAMKSTFTLTSVS